MPNHHPNNNRSPLPIAILISGNGTNLQAIIDAIDTGQLPATIQTVISNNPNAFGLQRAQQHQITTHIVDHKNYKDKNSFEHALIGTLAPYQPKLIVLAGFMRILSKTLIQHFAQKIINIHPSLLPAYRGLQTHQRVLADKARDHGCSIHVVTEALDSGPIIAQTRLPVLANDTPETLGERVREQEHKLLPQTIQWIATQQLRITATAIYFNNQVLNTPMLFQLDNKHD